MMKYTLCGRPQSCCPTVEVDEEDVTIYDDFGGKVLLTTDQFERLKVIDSVRKHGHVI
jgi:hypothetical protein